MSTVSMKVKYADNGLCRVYYSDEANRLLCYQSSVGSSFELYECTQDGEPSHCVPFTKYLGVTEYPSGDSRTEIDFCDWLFKESIKLINIRIQAYHDSYEFNGGSFEEDMSVNDYSRDIVSTYLKRFGECHLVKVNLYRDERGNRESVSKKIVFGDGQKIYNSCACMVLPAHSDELVDAILERDSIPGNNASKDMGLLQKIFKLGNESGGEILSWV